MKRLTNKELATRFGINLAKWKRWSREFLPPDPEAGMQSGIAREYSPEEAFTIVLGGFLVTSLKFSIPDAKIITKDLLPWFEAKGFLPLEEWPKRPLEDQVVRWEVTIERGKRGFAYQAKGRLKMTISERPEVPGGKVYRETYVLEEILPHGEREMNYLNMRTLYASTLIAHFLDKMAIA